MGRILEAAREALRTLRTSWLRTALTLFGIIWGSASVVFLISWGLGVREMLETAYLLRSPANADWLARGLAEARACEAVARELDGS